MRRTWLLPDLLLFLLSSPLWAQNDGAQKDIRASTTGTCSPVVTGTSSQVTINCNGLSAAKANQLVVLMNRILAERLDLSEVNTKLDQLQSDIGGLNAALRPLANAPAPVVALLKQAEVLVTQCTNLITDWSEHANEAMQDDLKARQADLAAKTEARREAREGARALSSTGDEDQRRGQEFARTYAPKLRAINEALHRLMPDAPAIPDVSVPTTPSQANNYAFQVFMLCQRYRQHQNQQGQAQNTRLVNDTASVFQDVGIFDKSWLQVQTDALHTARSTSGARPAQSSSPIPSKTDTQTAVNTKEIERYQTTLEPKLVSFRDAVLPEVPAFSSGRDYAQVNSVLQLSGVCMDVNQLGLAYREKAIEDQQRSQKTPVKGR